MIRFVCSLLLVLTSLSQIRAEVNIPQNCWVSNRPGGYCVYCSIEMIGRYYNIKNLYGIVDWYSKYPMNGADTREVKSCLDTLYPYYEVGEDYTIDWLKKQVSDGIPVLVGCVWDNGNHAIVIVDIGDKWVKYLDPNIRGVHTVNREWFDWAWKNSHRKNWAVKLIK